MTNHINFLIALFHNIQDLAAIRQLVEFTERGQYVVHGVTTVILKRFVMAYQDSVLRTDIG